MSSATNAVKKDTEAVVEPIICSAADFGTITITPPYEIIEYIQGMDLPDCISLVCNNYDSSPYGTDNTSSITSQTMDLAISVSCSEDEEGVQSPIDPPYTIKVDISGLNVTSSFQFTMPNKD